MIWDSLGGRISLEGTESGKWYSSTGKQVTHLFFGLMRTVPEPIKSIQVGKMVNWKDLGSAMYLRGTGSREWNSPAVRQVTHPILLLVWPVLSQFQILHVLKYSTFHNY